MRKIKLYLETSVWNFLFADDAPEKKRETELFFNAVGSGDYELYISGLVVLEIQRAPAPKRELLMGKIRHYKPVRLETSREVDMLALKYFHANFVPVKAYDDLMHAAIATVNDMDFLVSWNLSHIVRAKSIIEINRVNADAGYRELKICTVQGVMPDEI